MTKTEARERVEALTKRGILNKSEIIRLLVEMGCPYPGAKNFMTIGGGYVILERAIVAARKKEMSK